MSQLSTNIRPSRYWGPLLIVALGAALTTIVAFHLFRQQSDRQFLAFENFGRHQLGNVQSSIAQNIEVVESLAAFFDATGTVGRAAFRGFVRPALERHPGLLSLQWVPRVPAGDRAAVEAAARREGYTGFAIVEPAPDGTLVPAGPQDEYFPIYYLEPFEPFARIIGFDTASETVRRAALERARDSGEMVASDRITLIGDGDRFGFLVVKAVYAGGGRLGSVEERRRDLLGFVLGVFRLDDLVAKAMTPVRPPAIDLDLMIFDTDSPAEHQRVHPRDSVFGTPADLEGEVHIAESLPVAGRTWMLAVVPTGGQLPPVGWLPAAGVIAAGLLITFLLAARIQAEREQRLRYEAQSRAKSSFVANLSHELRTPLNTIMGFADMIALDLHAPSGEGRYREYATDILDSASHLLHLIGDIIDLSKIEAGRNDVTVEPFEVFRLVQQVRNAVEPLARAKANTLTIDCPAEVGIMKSDQRKIRQGLLNLLGNACKFTSGGEVMLAVCRYEDPHGAWVEFRVSDTGIGIPPEFLGSVFLPFVQVDAARTHPYGGSGLGLAITREFCRILGGGIAVASEPGQGTVFTIRLPTVCPDGGGDGAG